MPSNKTYTDTLAKCNYHEIAKVIAQVIVQARETKQCYDQSTQLTEQKKNEDENLTHVAVDGKTLRGTRKHERENQPPVHLLSFYGCESGIVLDHFSVEKKKNEYSTCVEILHPSLVKDHILTSDAGIGYKGWCEIIHALGGYYEIPLKNNHPAVRKKLIDFFQNDWVDRIEFQYHKEDNKGHGRQETREIWTSTQMNKNFQKEWAGIAQVFMIRRSVIETRACRPDKPI